MREKLFKYRWTILFGLLVFGGLAGSGAYIYSDYLFASGSESQDQANRSLPEGYGIYAIDATIPEEELFFWANAHHFFGDSFHWDLPMLESDFVEFLVVLNAEPYDPDLRKSRNNGDHIDYLQKAYELGFIPAEYKPQLTNMTSSATAYLLVKGLMAHEGYSITDSQMASWISKKESVGTSANLTWKEALTLLYRMKQFQYFNQQI